MEGMTTASLDAPAPLRRDWSAGLGNLLAFVRGTGGLDAAFEGMLALAGPTVDRQFQRFASDPVGRAMLEEDPPRDLNAFLRDLDHLRTLPEGSMAAAYVAYMGGVGMGSSDTFLEAAGIDEKARRFGWTDDQLWFVKRMANSHDLFHVVAGYGRDVIGEVGVDSYTAGQIPMLPLWIFLAYMMTLKPSSPVGWTRYVRDSYRHGKNTPSLACVDFEALFPLPIEEARERIGVPSLREAHPRGFPTKGRWLERLERRIEGR
jgi:ubiquinone biosynthesis protein COQ4